MIFRQILGIFLLFYSVISGFAQIPENYYAGTDGLTGPALKNKLYQIIKNHVTYPYTASSTDVWDILKQTDRDTLNPENVVCIYTGITVNAAQEYNNGNGWTREHVWAKSHGDFGTDKGAGTDIHHMRACLNAINTARNNRWFAESTIPYNYNSAFTGCYTGEGSGWTWEPRPNVKGDIARMLFYMAVRYEGENGEPNLELIDYLPNDNNLSDPVHAKLSDLIAWHLADPVDNAERKRNNIIYSFQNNRNPFIDYPEFVLKVWDGTVYLSGKSGIENTNPVKLKIIDDSLIVEIIKNSGKNVLQIFTLQGVLIASVPMMDNLQSVSISNFKTGIYVLRIIDKKTKKQLFTTRFYKN